ncbi:hypothetical protein [Clostridium lacusfryxellense]|uniref:hypothetical protein n=1 Tax=Clostridium lacusfryxellense TaxID=205328 RepID=UPI001C0D5E3D|nr:hypothetical protein [Clostridium lacusfryxellense]MBU3111027.1 hypothetical protein [Clostridium lacusfryxellense]
MALNTINKNNNKKKKNNRRKSVLLIVRILGSLVVLQSVIMHNAISKYEPKIYPEVWANDINIGGKTKEEAKKALVKNHSDVIAKKTSL